MHLIDFTVDQASSLVGRSLKEVNFRQQYGINVVSIIRGEQQINIPKGEERLYPFDKIIIVGTDEELDIFQGIMQKQEKEHRDRLTQSTNKNIKIEHVQPADEADSLEIIRQAAEDVCGICVEGGGDHKSLHST